MKIKRKRRLLTTQFSMASMTDVVFLLLIFFMLSVTFITPTGLMVDLPNSQQTDAIVPQINLTITSQLDYFIDGKPVHLDDLETVLSEKSHAKLIFLEIDKTVPVQYMIQVVDIANKLKLSVSVATKIE
jgi:biopolymer transport protein ExbD